MYFYPAGVYGMDADTLKQHGDRTIREVFT